MENNLHERKHANSYIIIQSEPHLKLVWMFAWSANCITFIISAVFNEVGANTPEYLKLYLELDAYTYLHLFIRLY